MRQRHVRVWFYLIAAFWIATITAWVLVMDHIKSTRIRPPFVDPVIWREPFTDGEEQLQPDI